MRISYLPDGSSDCPLLVIREFTPADVAALRAAARDLATGGRSQVEVSSDGGAAGAIGLVFRSGAEDSGIAATPPRFEFVLARETWRQVEGLLEPFPSEQRGTYQWLDHSGDVALLISQDGTW